jgi:hypothetical protein
VRDNTRRIYMAMTRASRKLIVTYRRLATRRCLQACADGHVTSSRPPWPVPLARLLREAGCDAFAVREIGLRETSDAEIWRYAVQQQAAIITKDEDFAERCLYSRDQPVIVWLRIGKTSNQAL